MYSKKKKQPTNRRRILECIYRNAPLARTEIAEITGITPATVTNTAAQLISDGIIMEVGEAATEEVSSGRRRILVDIVPDCAYSIGVEFSEKALAACICDMKGNICSQKVVPFTDDLLPNITRQVTDIIMLLIESSKLDWKQFTGIGIALPGHLSIDGNSLITNRQIWENFRPAEISDKFPIPVAMENNARCMALGAYFFHPDTVPDSFALFHVGRGMFCATMVDGELFLGNHYIAGEIGHTIVNENGPLCECGKRGCLQVYSSESRLVRTARMLYENSPNTMLRTLAESADDITLEQLITAYYMGDSAIGALINDALRYLSISTANIVITMNPGKIFMHGQLFAHEGIRTELMDHINRQLAFIGDPYTNSVEILPYSITNGALGACALAIDRFFL